jgi:iron complex transport system ATP-binding protein
MTKKALMEMEHVSFGYGKKSVLKDVSVCFGRGEIVSILGPNGSGKTTLLKLLLGLHRPDGGRVLLEGKNVSAIPPREMAKRIAYVPQDHRSAFAYRVLDMVLMGRAPHKPFFYRYSAADEEAALAALERLSIGHLKNCPYTEVSGGERQLTLIARAMTQGADIFVMDEPVNGLDYGNQLRLLERISELSGNGFTFIKTTHFPDHAVWISDRVVMLESGQVVADGDAVCVASEENLERLYGVPIGVMHLAAEDLRVCIPKIFGRSKKRSKEKHRPKLVSVCHRISE